MILLTALHHFGECLQALALDGLESLLGENTGDDGSQDGSPWIARVLGVGFVHFVGGRKE